MTPVTMRPAARTRTIATCVKEHAKPATTHRSLVLGILVSTLLPLAVCGPTLGPWIEFSPDSFLYLRLGRTLIETGAFPAERVTTPPGFPLLLAPLLAAGDLPLVGLRVLTGAAFIATCVLTFLLHRRWVGDRWAMLVAALTATCPALLTQSASLLSEIVFIPLTLLALIVLSRWKAEGLRGWGDAAGGGAAVAAAAMVRTMGLLLAPIAVWTAWRSGHGPIGRRLAQAGLVAAIAVGPSAAWQIRQSAYPRRHGYVDSLTLPRAGAGETTGGLGLQIDRLMRFGPQRMADLKAALVPNRLCWQAFSGPLATACTWAVGLAVVVLVGWRCATQRLPGEMYVFLSAAVLAVWPWYEGERLVAPLVPIIYGSLIGAASRAWRAASAGAVRASRRRRWFGWTGAAGAAIGVLLIVQAAECGLTVASLGERGPVMQGRTAGMAELGAWLATHHPADDAVHAVVPKGTLAKLTLIGAGYLGRKTLVVDDAPAMNDLDKMDRPAECVLVHRSIARVAARAWRRDSIGQSGEFVLLGPATTVQNRAR